MAGEHKGGWEGPHHGTTADGKSVTVSFGTGNNDGHTLLSDGHKPNDSFFGGKGSKGHDHYDGKGGGTERGQYTGYGSQ